MGRERLPSIFCVVNFADSSLEDKSKAQKIRLRFPAM